MPFDAQNGDDLSVGCLKKAIRKADAIVHLAAVPGVVECRDDHKLAFETNVVGTQNILRIALEQEKRVVFASSQAARIPLTVYGATKRASEGLITGLAQECGLDGVSLRFSNIYGEHSKHKNSVISKWCQDFLKTGEIELHGDGEQRRNFIYVRDVCRAILRTLQQTAKWHGEVFDVISEKELSLNELYNVFCDVVGTNVDIKELPPRDNALYEPDSFDILPMWKPRTNFYSGLQSTWEWYNT